jgi:hypothetical protein
MIVGRQEHCPAADTILAGATFLWVTLRRLDTGPGNDTGVNSSLRALLKRRRTSSKPTSFAKIEPKIRDGMSPTWGGERIERPARKGCGLRNYPTATRFMDDGPTMEHSSNARSLCSSCSFPDPEKQLF